MDDDANEEQGQNPLFTGNWTATSSYDIYMVKTPKKTNNDDKEDPVRINLLRHSPDAGVSGTALSHVVQKTTTPAPKKTILRTMPKTMKTLLGQSPNRMNGKTAKLALMNRPYTKTRRTVIIFLSSRMRRASATRISSCLRNLSSRSALNAG